MISVVIATLNSEATLPSILACLVPAAVDGIVREVIICDAGSRDQTLAIADVTGADVISAPAERSAQLNAGAKAAKSGWLLFLPDGGALSPGWEREAAAHITTATQRDGDAAAAGRFEAAPDGSGLRASAAHMAMSAAHIALGLSAGGGGLLIARAQFVAAGGLRPIAGLEDVDLIHRLGRRIVTLRARLITGADPTTSRSLVRQFGHLLAYRVAGPSREAPSVGGELGTRPAAR